MRKPENRTEASVADNREPLDNSSNSLDLKQLKREFAIFRRENPPRSKIPQRLRKAALDCLHAGVSRTELRSHCFVSWSQLQTWQEHDRNNQKKREASEPAARVFSVCQPNIDELPEPAISPQAPHSDLEMKLGNWSITIRQCHPQKRKLT